MYEIVKGYVSYMSIIKVSPSISLGVKSASFIGAFLYEKMLSIKLLLCHNDECFLSTNCVDIMLIMLGQIILSELKGYSH